jgi:outer membrane lipoprotein-sorting protein
VADAAPVDPALPLAGLSDEQVLAAATAAMGRVDTMSARFVQTAPSGEVTSGRAYLDRPGRLRFDYDEPSAQLIVAVNGLVYVHDSDLETTDSYPVSKTPLRFLLAEEVGTEGAVLAGVERGPGEVAVTLEAADEDLAGQVALVFEAGEDDALTLSRWAVFDPRGGVTVVSLEDQVFGERLSRRLFTAPEANDRFLDRR